MYPPLNQSMYYEALYKSQIVSSILKL